MCIYIYIYIYTRVCIYIYIYIYIFIYTYMYHTYILYTYFSKGNSDMTTEVPHELPKFNKEPLCLSERDRWGQHEWGHCILCYSF